MYSSASACSSGRRGGSGRDGASEDSLGMDVLDDRIASDGAITRAGSDDRHLTIERDAILDDRILAGDRLTRAMTSCPRPS